MSKRENSAHTKKRFDIGYGKILLGVFAGMVFVFLVIPSFLAVPMSVTETRFLVFPPQGFTFHWFDRFATDELWRAPALFSLKLAILTTLVSLILGFMTSLALVRGSLPGRKILNVFLISPIMVPVIIIAFAVYGVYAKLHLIGSTLGLVVAHSILCTPFVILVISANLYRFDISMEMAARNLGATPIKTFLFITIPIIKPGIIAAAVFCFITSLDELVIAMFLIGTRRTTLPIKIFSQLQFRIDPVVAAASTIFIAAAFVIVISLLFMARGTKETVIKEPENASFTHGELS